MKKILKALFLLTLVGVLFLGVVIQKDKQNLQSDLIRLHVVANSDSEEDQAVKLQVRDAIISYLEPLLHGFSDQEQVKELLQSKLSDLQAIANRVLKDAGFSYTAKATLKKEKFDTRVYDTFSLPAGVYDSLRIEIGQAQGKNWWCVVFPSLCLSATSEEFQDTAAAAGFDEELVNTLAGEDGYELRFYLLECLGKWENFFFKD